MREIKFRVWNGKKILSWDIIKQLKTVLLSKILEGKHLEYIPMQYTGLKDRNGKEIYEGDIIEYSIQGIIQIPYYVVKDMQDIRLQMNRDDLYYCRDEKITVVGNIYEDKHLLTN